MIRMSKQSDWCVRVTRVTNGWLTVLQTCACERRCWWKRTPGCSGASSEKSGVQVESTAILFRYRDLKPFAFNKPGSSLHHRLTGTPEAAPEKHVKDLLRVDLVLAVGGRARSSEKSQVQVESAQ